MKKIKEMYFIPVVGTEKIGFNCSLYGLRLEDGITEWIMVDLGVSFSGCGHLYEVMTPSIEAIIKNRPLSALVITHAHEDHIGGVGYLHDKLNCPVYLTRFAKEILTQKLGKAAANKITLKEVDGRFSVGHFDLSLVHVNHSTPESRSVIFHMPFGNVVKTGDWKIDREQTLEDGIDLKKFEELGREGVYAVLGDSTNVFQEGRSGSEASVYRDIKKFLEGERVEGQIIATCFASNLQRVYSLAKIGYQLGRKIFLLGRSMETFVRVGKKTGYVEDFPPICRESAESVPKSKRFIICAGSQGDERSSLSSIAKGMRKDICIEGGDLILFSSRAIPGNEEPIIRLQNIFISKGARIVTGLHFRGIHVSGHAHREEIKELYGLLKPEICIPLHGTQLNVEEHADLARGMGIKKVFTLRDGDIFRLYPDPEVLGEVSNPGEKMFLDNASKDLLSFSGEVATQREAMCRWGSVHAALLVNKKKAVDAKVSILGLVEGRNPRLKEITCTLEKQLLDMPLDSLNLEVVRKRVAKLLRDKGVRASPVVSLQLFQLNA